jgi:hypothetical protein
MKRKLHPILLLVFWTLFLGINHTYGQITSLTSAYFFPVSGTFTPLVGGTTVAAIHGDDQASGLIPIGFTFNYLGTAYTDCYASSNGYLTFSAANTSLTNNLTTGAGRPIFAPLWDDLQGNVGNASYQTSGTPGSRVFTFEWLNWKWYYTVTSATISFQCKLYEATGAIEFVYRQEGGTMLGTETASIGITGSGTGTGNIISLSNSSSSPTISTTTETNNIGTRPANGQSYIFTPLNNPNPAGSTSGGGPVTIPPIASYAYSNTDTVWLSSPTTLVSTSVNSTKNYWDIIGYNSTNKNGPFAAYNEVRDCKTSEDIDDCFIDTVGNAVNFRYTFNQPGYYRLKLVSLNKFGFDTYIDTIFVDTPSAPPVADFFADRRTIGVYDYASMFDLSSNGPTSWNWYLNPLYYNPLTPFFNSFSPQTGQNPTLNANEGGIFEVCMVASNLRGSDTMCKPGYMKIISGYEVCKGTSTSKDTIA